MRRTHLILPLALAALLACQPTDDPSTAPSLGATSLKIPNPYFLIFDEDPSRNYTMTIGLVSPPGDLDACEGSGPEEFDGGGTTRIVETPSGAVHVRDELHQATIVFYEGATADVCELATHEELARGTGNMHFTVKSGVNGSTSIQATFGGILNLTEGGRVHALGVGHIVFDRFGNLFIREDHFTLKPVGH